MEITLKKYFISFQDGPMDNNLYDSYEEAEIALAQQIPEIKMCACVMSKVFRYERVFV